jgi:hypothetical protein
VHVRILFLLYCRIVANSSEEMFQIIFSKLKTYLRGKIVEPNVAGGILASMCKSVVQANPQAGLAFFIPYLCSSITRCYGVKYSSHLQTGVYILVRMVKNSSHLQTGVYILVRNDTLPPPPPGEMIILYLL